MLAPPTLGSRPLVALSLALACASCGARSDLLDEGGAGGSVGAASTSSASGSSASGSSTVTTSAGSGGAPPACLLSDPTAYFPFDAFFDEAALTPQLVPLTDTDDRFALTLAGKTGMGFPHLWHAPVDPWSPPVDAVVPLSGSFPYTLIDPSYAVARSSTPGSYALEIGFSPPPPGVTFDAEVIPGASTAGVELPLISQFPGIIRPSFIARRTASSPPVFEHLLGYEQIDGANHRLRVRLVSPMWGNPEHGQALACGDLPIPARGTGTQGAFFLVAGSSNPLGGCDDPQGGFGVPSRLQVTFYNQPLGQVLTPLLEIKDFGLIEAVDVALGDGSLWVAWATYDDGTHARLRLARVGLTGTLLTGPIDVAQIARPATLSIARFGDRLAMAAIQATDGGQRVVSVRIIEPNGEPFFNFVVVPGSVNGVAIAGEPNGKRLLLAVTQDEAASAGRPILLTRYGCL